MFPQHLLLGSKWTEKQREIIRQQGLKKK